MQRAGNIFHACGATLSRAGKKKAKEAYLRSHISEKTGVRRTNRAKEALFTGMLGSKFRARRFPAVDRPWEHFRAILAAVFPLAPIYYVGAYYTSVPAYINICELQRGFKCPFLLIKCLDW